MLEEKYHIKGNYGQALIIISFLSAFCAVTYGQPDRKFIRQGNHEYEKGKYPDSEISYRKATDRNKESADAVFNTGDALYKQKKFEDAGKQFAENFKMSEEKNKKSASLYNLGNSLLMASKVQESIDAYKGSLKLDPKNMNTKYNLAYAQDLLKKQQQQQQQQQQQNKDQDKNKKDKDKDKNQQNKDNKDNQDKKNQNQNQDNNQQQQQNQQQEQGISKEDADRVLNSLADDEKKVQQKVKLANASKVKVRTIKNW